MTKRTPSPARSPRKYIQTVSILSFPPSPVSTTTSSIPSVAARAVRNSYIKWFSSQWYLTSNKLPLCLTCNRVYVLSFFIYKGSVSCRLLLWYRLCSSCPCDLSICHLFFCHLCFSICGWSLSSPYSWHGDCSWFRAWLAACKADGDHTTSGSEVDFICSVEEQAGCALTWSCGMIHRSQRSFIIRPLLQSVFLHTGFSCGCHTTFGG